MASRDNNLLWKVVIYKLLYDALVMLFLILAFLLTAEALLPGYLSRRLSFVKIILLIFANTAAIFFLKEKIEIVGKKEQKKPGKYFLAGLAFFFALIMAAALLKFNWTAIILISFITLSVFYYFDKIFLKSN